jgi:anthranilate synthase/aminodeoxychorismate synthase-like glutamine amidotransferase
MVIVIDNYDSFVYNIAQYLGELGCQPVVHRNDHITPLEIEKLAPSHIIISPGPGTPLESGASNDIIRSLAGKVPILGVCLGHQCIGYVFGGKIVPAPVPTHGKRSLIYHDGKTIYKGIPKPFGGGRYHSLVIDSTTLPPSLELSAETSDGVVMGVRHKDYPIEGIQFHPESIMTEVGHDIMKNFLNLTQE